MATFQTGFNALDQAKREDEKSKSSDKVATSKSEDATNDKQQTLEIQADQIV